MAEGMTIHYGRKLPDGNYGNEELSMSVTLELDGHEITDEYLQTQAWHLRRTVLGVLSQSAAYAVAQQAKRELEPPKVAAAVAAGDPEGTQSLEDLPF